MRERHIAVQRHIPASVELVWDLFADFPNLATHWSGLRGSSAIGDQTRGEGARRRVELRPIGNMVEVVTVWVEGRTLATRNQPSASVPVKRAESVLTFEPSGGGALVTFDYRYTPRGGPIGRATGPLLDRMLTASFADMLAATEKAALSNT